MKYHVNKCSIFFLFFISIYLDNGHTVELTIDNRLLYIPPDCYTRVSIGSRIVDSLVISTIQANVVADCEAACSANGTSCGSFSFGIGSRGNGSCALSNRIPNGPSDLQRDSNYDVYAKGKISLRGCYTGSRKSLNTSEMIAPSPVNQKQNVNQGNSRLFGNNSFLNIGNTLFNRNKNSNRNFPTLGRPVSPYSFTSDDQYRITDILNNRKQYEPMNNENEDKWSISQLPNDFNYFPIITGNHLRPNENHPFFIIEEEHMPDDVFGRKLNHKINEFSVPPVLRKFKPSDDDDYVTGLDYFAFGQRLNPESTTDNWKNSGVSIKRPSNVHNYGVERVKYKTTNERKDSVGVLEEMPFIRVQGN